MAQQQSSLGKEFEEQISSVNEVLSKTSLWDSKMRLQLIAGLEAQEREADWTSASIPMTSRPDATEIVKILKSEFDMTDRSIASAIGRTNSAVGKIFRGEVAQPRPDLVEALQKLLIERQQGSHSS